MQEAVLVPVGGGIRLEGDLEVPDAAHGLVLFAHGSGSSRHSGRNRAVAKVLRAIGLATLLLDLLTPVEQAEDTWAGHRRFDLDVLTRRLERAAAWLAARPSTAGLPLGVFGAATSDGVALALAARRPELVRAVVCRGGRLDLATEALDRLRAPTLLIVGGADEPARRLHLAASERLRGRVELAIVPGATHLFEEPGALGQVAALTANWFQHWLAPADRQGDSTTGTRR